MPGPDVIVDFLFEDGLLFIAVTNIGTEPATQVRIAFDKPFRGLNGAVSMPDLAMFQHIEFLAPGRTIRTLVDSASSYFLGQQPTTITATVDFTSRDEKAQRWTILHDLSIYRDITFLKP